MKVSVMVCTYNQADLLPICLDSILTQEGNFEIEVRVGDDGSTDGAQRVLADYAQRYPGNVFPYYFENNVGPSRNALTQLLACSGEYIALVDGDDYWPDTQKLLKQIELLETHQECAGCFADSARVDATGAIIAQTYFDERPKERYCLDDIVKSMGNTPSNTLIWRRQVTENAPYWFRKSPRHSGFHLLITQHGDLAYLDRCCGAYRVHSNGSWSNSTLLYRLHSDLLYFKHLMFDRNLSSYRAHFLRQFLDALNGCISEIQNDAGSVLSYTADFSDIDFSDPTVEDNREILDVLVRCTDELLIFSNHFFKLGQIRQSRSLIALAAEISCKREDKFDLFEQLRVTEPNE